MQIIKGQIPSLEKKSANHVLAKGCWRVEMMAIPDVLSTLQATIKSLNDVQNTVWDLSEIGVLDYMGALFLWRTWGNRRPQHLTLDDRHANFFKRIEEYQPFTCPPLEKKREGFLVRMGRWFHILMDHTKEIVQTIGQLTMDIGQLVRKLHRGPWKEISANIYHAGAQALGITALVGFLIGIVLSYLSAQPLRVFGGESFLVNLLGLGIVRELGPLLAAILVAGRSGSAITAQLGVMRVTEELDAMVVMGLPQGFRVIMPKVLGLAIAMPLIVVWTSICALVGGMLAAKVEVGLSIFYFVSALPGAVPIESFWIGIGKGVIFGILIALIACHLGIRIRPNTESLGRNTTTSVVASITAVILVNALLSILLKDIGF